MKPGPSPKPTALKRLAGNPGGRPLNELEPRFPVPKSVPYAPRHLNEEAKKEWRQLAPLLLEAGLFTEADRMALAMVCQAWGDWVEAIRKVEETGGRILASKDTGNLYHNPWLAEVSRAWDQMRRMLGHFGLSPAERSRVHGLVVSGPEPTLAELLFSMIDEGKDGNG